jgi:hypothetical protein
LERAKLYPSSFEEFCERIEEFENPPRELMFSSQVDWISDVHGKRIIDFVGYTENIQGDFDVICKALRRPRVLLPHLNRPKRGFYQDLYNERTRKIVEKAYQDDIETFGYTV